MWATRLSEAFWPQDLFLDRWRPLFSAAMFPADPVPEQIGAYQVLKYVGRSGSADVYIARMDGPLGFSRDVTLKLVHAGRDEDARFAEELAREASICARLNHPAVVRMFDFFECDRRLVLVLEQVEGASLDKLVGHLARRKQKIGDVGIFFLASQLAAGLAHAHGSADEDGNLSPVIHRDIKPENVHIGWDGNVRLAGFGLGKILGHSPDSVVGTIRGTPGYMSPEQFRGERATVRSDVYGFGILLWSLLSGLEPPLDAGKPAPLGELRPDLPRELVAAVDAALEASADRRRITCAELAQWLSKLTKPEPGREELRQKVLWLRATRGPASKLDPARKPRVPKRRQAIQASRPSSRRPGASSSRPPSSYGPPPSSRAPASSRVPPLSRSPSEGAPSGSEAGSESQPPSASQAASPSNVPRPGFPRIPSAPVFGDRPEPLSSRPQERSDGMPTRPAPPLQRRPHPASARPATQEDSVVLKLPPPPALPGAGGPHTPRKSNGGSASHHTTSGPPTLRPSSVSVRTVSAPPPSRSVFPAYRAVVAPEDMIAAEHTRTDAWRAPSPAPEAPHDASHEVPHPNGPGTNAGPTTARPVKQGTGAFNLTTQLLLSVLTAGLVVTFGLLALNRSAPQPAQPPQIVTVEVNRQPDPDAQNQPKPKAEQPSAPELATSAPTPVNGQPLMPDPSMLADGMGYLVVKGPDETDVYLNGRRRGPTNEALMVPCGKFFLRLAPKDTEGFYKTWTSPGQTVIVDCNSSKIVTARPNPPPLKGSVQL